MEAGRIRIVVSTLLAICLMLPCLGGAQAAASVGGQLVVGMAAGKGDSVVTVPVSLQSDGSVAAVQFRLTYDGDALELAEVRKGADLPDSYQIVAGTNNGKVAVGSLGGAIGSGTKVIAIAEFRIKANAAPGNYSIGLFETELVDGAARSLTDAFQLEGGAVEVKNSDYVFVTGVALSPQTLRLTAGGGTAAITATVKPAGATNPQVVWQSSNPQAAKVAGGVVTPLAAGTTTITAETSDGGYRASTVVTVVSPAAESNPPGAEEEQAEELASIDVLVNGVREAAGSSITTTQHNRQVTTVRFDDDKLAARLEREEAGAIITVPVAGNADIVLGVLNGRMVKGLEQKRAVVDIRADVASYTIPAEQINVEALAEQFGDVAELGNIEIEIEISALPDEDIAFVKSVGSVSGWTILMPPVQFAITARYGDAAIEVTQFQAYVERRIAIPGSIDPFKVATALVIEADGSTRQAPTRIVQEQDRYYAVINSLSNSIYALVHYEETFRDIAGHWGERDIGELGARMIVGGKGDGLFHPDEFITRAEFAAIVVRGLGLKQRAGTGNSPFTDVAPDDWHHGVVLAASESGLISGYSDGTFRPDDGISRQEAMVIVSRAMAVTGLKRALPELGIDERLRTYADAPMLAEWAREGAAASVQGGLVTGRTSTMLAPESPMTRSEVAAIVKRLLQKSRLID